MKRIAWSCHGATETTTAWMDPHNVLESADRTNARSAYCRQLVGRIALSMPATIGSPRSLDRPSCGPPGSRRFILDWPLTGRDLTVTIRSATACTHCAVNIGRAESAVAYAVEPNPRASDMVDAARIPMLDSARFFLAYEGNVQRRHGRLDSTRCGRQIRAVTVRQASNGWRSI